MNTYAIGWEFRHIGPWHFIKFNSVLILRKTCHKKMIQAGSNIWEKLRVNINQSLFFTKKIKQLSLLNPPKTNSPMWNLIVVLQLELVATRLIVAVLNCCVKFSCHGYRVDNIDLISFLLFSIRTRRSLINKQKSDIRYILVKTDSHCPVKYCCYLDFVLIKSWLSHLSSRIAWELPKVLDTQLNFLSGS